MLGGIESQRDPRGLSRVAVKPCLRELRLERAAEICNAMIDDYDVSREVLQQDLLTLIRDLVEKKLMIAE